MRHTNVQLGVTTRDTTEDKHGHGKHFFEREFGYEFQAEATHTVISLWAIETGRRRVKKPRDVEVNAGLEERIEAFAIEVHTEISSGVGARKTEFINATLQFFDRSIDVLHRQRRQTHEPVWMPSNDRRKIVVMGSTVGNRILRGNEVEIRERVRRQRLHTNIGRIHSVQPHADLHEERFSIRNTIEAPVADPEPRRAVFVGSKFWSTDWTGGAERAFQNDVSMHVDQSGHVGLLLCATEQDVVARPRYAATTFHKSEYWRTGSLKAEIAAMSYSDINDHHIANNAGPTVFHTIPFAETLLRGAQSHPERDCIVLLDERVTYGELAQRAQLAGRALMALGIERGDRVGILMANCLDFTDMLFGASLIGAVPVLYNARFKAREIAHITNDAGVKVVMTNDIVEQHTDYVALLDEADIHSSPLLDAAVFLGTGSRDGFVDRDAFYDLAAQVDQAAVDARHADTQVDDIALMFYTSGTTAMPKGCPLTHVVLQHAGVVGGVDRFGLVEADVMWGPLPMFHSAFTQPLSGTLHVGGTYVSMTHFEPGDALNQIKREGVTVAFPAFPTITLQLLNHERYTPDTLRSVRVMLNVGPPEELVAMQQQMPHTTQITAFGMSECGGSVCICDPADSIERRTACSGTALPGIEIEIRDPESGETLQPGAQGEIVARGRGVFSGYYNDPIKTAESFYDDGWFRTGDLGSMDSGGCVTFRGRLKDMLKVGGENVAAVEVEGFLATHPAVNLAQVVPLPDAKYGEVPVAFVELLTGESASEQEIIDFCRGQIAGFKVPRHVRFVDEWPMGATKILKYELRDRICDELGRAKP